MGANGLAAYCSSKWGIRGLTKVARWSSAQGRAREFDPPGGIDTAMGNPYAEQKAEVNKRYTWCAAARRRARGSGAHLAVPASDDSTYLCGAEIAVTAACSPASTTWVSPARRGSREPVMAKTASEESQPDRVPTGYFWYRHGMSQPGAATPQGKRSTAASAP